MPESPKSVYGKCLLHGRDVADDGICPECRKHNSLTDGDYLREFGAQPDVPRVFRRAFGSDQRDT